MTFPSKSEDIPPPHTDIDNPLLNIKPRVVECHYCKYSVETDLPSPRCGKCNHQLITSIDGKLAERNS